MLDATTLRVAFGITALALLLLFYFVTYRGTRAPYSRWWSRALACFLLGNAAYLFDGTVHQVWANPLGNALLLLGAGCVWAGAASLRRIPPRAPVLLAAPLITLVVSAFDDPANNDWSGGPLLLGFMSGLLGLAARELHLLDRTYSRARIPLVLTSAALSVFYLFRLVAFLAEGPDGAVFSSVFGTVTTTLVTMVLLVVVSFSMAGLSSEQLARDLVARAARNTRELSRGGQVQRNLLPQSSPELDGYEVAGACIPSGTVSGDFFDWQPTRDGLALTVADVMGKGVGAAMIAATVRAALRASVPTAGMIDTVTRVDEVVDADLEANEAFVTMFHARLVQVSGELAVADAGHGLAVIVRHDGGQERISSTNLPLGVQGGQYWGIAHFRLAPGDLLLAFSDGLLDLFGGTLDTLTPVIASAAAAGSAAGSVAHIERLASRAVLDDDVTVVAVRRMP